MEKKDALERMNSLLSCLFLPDNDAGDGRSLVSVQRLGELTGISYMRIVWDIVALRKVPFFEECIFFTDEKGDELDKCVVITSSCENVHISADVDMLRYDYEAESFPVILNGYEKVVLKTLGSESGKAFLEKWKQENIDINETELAKAGLEKLGERFETDK